jgi:hypothetical protein
MPTSADQRCGENGSMAAAEGMAPGKGVRRRTVLTFRPRDGERHSQWRATMARRTGVLTMATAKQKTAARKNIKKAAKAAKKKKTLTKLPKAKRTALGKEGAKAAKRKRSR